ncbi:MAG: ribonuclease Z [Clostridia bacterium]|nr:ribonuclease Z [Clostridia bacterium]
MVAIICVDPNNGMMFNRRRQSRDRAVLDAIMEQVRALPLAVSEYSARLFLPEYADKVDVCSDFTDRPLCFFEDFDPAPFKDRICALVLFRWDKVYPADTYLPFEPLEEGFMLDEISQFVGTSHEKITMEVYSR